MSLDALTDDVTKHVPRAYQEELFHISRRQNVIAALDTGSGKTFIAAMLIKSMCAMPGTSSKKVIFLVPKVPLVDQQRDFLEEQTPLRIRGYKGAMGVDNWDKSTWHKEFDNADVLVMTAQIFKNILTHAFWAIDKVSLLVFDECHHARNNHPFNTIMMDHYVNCDPNNRPKIFGMTASPVWNERQPAASIQKLQSNLFARVYAVKQHSQDLQRHAPKPTEIIVHYEPPPSIYPDYPVPSLWTELVKGGLTNGVGLRIESIETRYGKTFDSLGPAAAEYYLHKVLSARLQEEIRGEYEDNIRRLKRPKLSHKDPISESTVEVSTGPSTDTHTSQKILRSILLAVEGRLSVDAFPSTWMAPKYCALIKLLKQHESASFRGILFAEQRQVAATLTWLLTKTSETKDWIKCAELMGHGDLKGGGDVIAGMGLNVQENVVKSFRTGELNLLIATSVAEEGLDFPACDLVIRFDPIRNMVAYVQSRGRARQKASTFVIMIDEKDELELARYKKLRDIEPELKKSYQQENTEEPDGGRDEDEERDDPRDLEAREVHIVPSTGATLTYHSAIPLLNRLCSFIPRDSYSLPFKPHYIISTVDTGFRARITLPTALPLPKELHEVEGPIRHSKKEARRAVAYEVVRALHGLGVFDDHLSPSKPRKGNNVEDADGIPIPKTSDVPEIMEVMVKYPWSTGPPWYLHSVSIDGICCAGMITGARLPTTDLTVGAQKVVVEGVSPDAFDLDADDLNVVDRYTRMGIWWCISGSPVLSNLGCYLVALDANDQLDWDLMRASIVSEKGSYDWSAITSEHEGKLVLMNGRKYAKSLLLIKIRKDVCLSDERSQVGTASSSDLKETYAEFFEREYPGVISSTIIPQDNPIIEVMPYKKISLPVYALRDGELLLGGSSPSDCESSTFLLPQWFCKHAPLSEGILRTLRVFSPLCQRITDVYRAHQAIKHLGLPDIKLDRMVEALVIPSAVAGFNNQRLETLGDSVLKLSVVTYIYNRYPFKHEGQLDQLKRTSVSNRCLLARGKHRGLEMFITSESRFAKGWHFTLDQDSKDLDGESFPPRSVRRRIPRRSMQDCMEATLGAAFLSGGINLALEAGYALGLSFGGHEPWPTRYSRREREGASCPALFNALQDKLQYTFRNGDLLLEAIVHPSFGGLGGICYQRLEFLGDAVMDLVTVTHIFHAFPTANSGQMSWMRSQLICNVAFATVAVKRFSLQKYLLSNNVALSKAITEETEILEAASYEDVIHNIWKYDPPKVLGDIFESVIGAVFVDSGFDFELTTRIAKLALEDVLPLIHLDMPKDPVSNLYVFVGKAGCQKIRFKKEQSNPEVKRNDSIVVLVHDIVIAGPVLASTLPLAKATASVDALALLQDEGSELSLQKVCDCVKPNKDSPSRPREEREKDLDNETEEGFAVLSKLRIDEISRDEQAKHCYQQDPADENDNVEMEEIEVV
ncbi:hypothetical protein SCHPADRAFT_843134, partial [Schizopora paradoxa]